MPKNKKQGAQENRRSRVLKQGVQGICLIKQGVQGIEGADRGKIGSMSGPVRLPNFSSQYRNTSYRSFWNKYKKDRTISVRSLIGYQLCLYILLKQLLKQLMQLVIKICKPISALTLLGVRDSLMARLSRLLIQGLIEILKHGFELGGRNHCSLS